jgi:telomerase reverse transcriptase
MVEKFIYWIFAHFIIPLLQCNFYVTENGQHRNKLFYYRRSVWALIRGMAIREMKSTLFEVVQPVRSIIVNLMFQKDKAQAILANRAFSFSYIRILPKTNGIRPILNFGRKPKSNEPGKSAVNMNAMDIQPTPIAQTKKDKQDFNMPVQSINSLLQNTFGVLTYEKVISTKILLILQASKS